MKKNITLFALAIASMATLFSCSKSSSSSTGSMSATINGKSFSSHYCIGAAVTGTSELSISGFAGSSSASYPVVIFTVNNFNNAPGTFPIDGTTVTGYIDSTGSSFIYASSGSITVSSYTSSLVTGTYSFTCSDGTTVTGGTFSAIP